MPLYTAQMANCFCDVEPEEEEQAVAKEEEEEQKAALQGENTGAQESMQIEEVSLQEGQQGNDSSSQQGDTAGVVGAMMGAAKSLFGGGKHDEQVCLLLLPNFLYRYRASETPNLVLYRAAMQDTYLPAHVDQCKTSTQLSLLAGRYLSRCNAAMARSGVSLALPCPLHQVPATAAVTDGRLIIYVGPLCQVIALTLNTVPMLKQA